MRIDEESAKNTRTLPFAGASNFRDLGGYPGHGGRGVKWRCLFRSDHLADLTAQDRALFATLGVARAVDFRGQAESAASAYVFPGVAYHPLAIEPTVVQRALELQRSGRQLSAQDAVGLMQETYRGFVHDSAPRFAALFRLLLDERQTPLVFHCTAGKDRTGFAAALILLALGVARDLVMQDYLLTNALYRRPKGVGSHTSEEVLAVLWRVQEEFLNAALHRVDQDFGGVAAYLADALGVDSAAQRELAGRYLRAP
ncbi:tyrosine-protein phosphatase [Verminephrobacter aporrectodeae subsp. tuberculatae]|uniref:Tyrosine-protein phosphatase n=1 Tax=Verminephrobacter aporrectodeae subsp. tuberculatae TaxID=1110392 RepID=A0ABT3KR61_9BURK|nr:tyrosine-protein phosphatase [Verminephrobacter aporrectodeae]MCW5320808.1 tyrosine-protein phosphatase [Verminephrobacter aporrectodeae subsp. tuberculatae]